MLYNQLKEVTVDFEMKLSHVLRFTTKYGKTSLQELIHINVHSKVCIK